jgi:4-amino-4-deoxy-L-arabinose transferase-like glycosyltransferase
LEKYEFLIPLALFIVFLAITLPGISWGGLNGWHPDEVVVRSIKALHGQWQFDEINFDYPSLPQYVMFGLGKLILGMGYTDLEVLIVSRLLSAVLAGLTIVLTYFIARRISHNVYISGFSAMVLLSVSEMTHNGRFAHNDTYITFFVTLTILFLINYKITNRRGWLYASFITVGMAASSKYNGISLVLVPVALYLFSLRHALLKRLIYRGRTDLPWVRSRHTQILFLDDVLFQTDDTRASAFRELCAPAR